MTENNRRVIRRPPGVDDSRWSQLGLMLADAVERQRHFAERSPHILRFLGELQREPDGNTFFVAHEPASPTPITPLFDRLAPPVPASELLRFTAALFQALRTAHEWEKGRPIAHGGVSPGAVLHAPDGVVKLTDFGFAPAICTALGVEGYVNLAVGVSGAWEVLTADEFGRDDRICAFIDPQKYGSRMLNAFEPGSDVIAAGIVLHLLAEHQHPYLYVDPDAHRLVAMSEFMAMEHYNGARRKDLRESSDPGVRAWCDCIARTLARVPHDRPTAGDVVEAMAAYVRPEDAADVLRRRMHAIEELAYRRQYDQARDALRSLIESGSAPDDLQQRARTLLVQAEANLLLDRASDVLQSDTWAAAREPIDSVLAMPDLTPELAERARALAEALNANTSATLLKTDHEAARAWTAQLREAVDAEQWDAADSLLRDRPQVEHWPEELIDQPDRLAARVRAAIRRQADEQQAHQWCLDLARTVEAGDWATSADLLTQRPILESWPPDALDEADRCRREIEARLAPAEWQRHRAEAEHRLAVGWIGRANEAVVEERWEEALSLLDSRPPIDSLPPKVVEDAEKLRKLCRSRLGDQVLDRLQARTEAVETLARQFVHRLVAEKLAQLVQPDVVDVRIDAEEFVSEHPSADGRAVLHVRVRVRGPGGAPDEPEIATPVHFRADREPRGICDDAGELADRLTNDLKNLLGRLQAVQAASLAEPLRQGLFPQAKAALKRTEAAGRNHAAVNLLGASHPGGTVEAEITWDPARLIWNWTEPARLADRAVRVAAKAAAGELADNVLKQSELLRRYRSVLTVEATPTSAASGNEPPSPLELQARIGIRAAGAATPQTLLEFTVSCARLGTLTWAGDLTPAEARLLPILTEAQNQDVQAITADLRSRIELARSKAKLRVLPEAISQPVERVTFTLTTRGREPLDLAGEWSADKFAFTLPEGWQERTADYLSGRTGGEAGSPFARVAQLARRLPRRAAAPIAAVAVLIVLISTWALWPASKPTPTIPTVVTNGKPTPPIEPDVHPPQNDNAAPPDAGNATTSSANDNTEPPPDPGQRLRERIATLKDRFDTIASGIDAVKPTHELLAGFIKANAAELRGLSKDSRSLLDSLGDGQAALRAEAKPLADRIGELLAKIDAYSPILDLSGRPLAEQVDLYKKAQALWPTEYITDQLAKLERIDNSLAVARAADDWRCAMHLLDQTVELARSEGLADTLKNDLDAARRQIAKPHTDQTAGAAAVAQEWIKTAKPPADPMEHLAALQNVAKARTALDQLDFAPGDPDENEVTKALLGWVQVSLPLPGAESVTIDLTFIPADPKKDIAALWMGQTEVTVAQYRAVVGSLPAPDKSSASATPKAPEDAHPVGYVTVEQAQEFCRKLNERIGSRIVFRLPYDDEWTYAFLAGRATWLEAAPGLRTCEPDGSAKLDLHKVNLQSDELARERSNEIYYEQGNEDGFALYAPVMRYPPNRWGLYDMLGNVQEWVVQRGQDRCVTEGGSFLHLYDARSQTLHATPDTRKPYEDIGFRIVATPGG